ncbi:MAG: DUF4149 domain-containing protein [Campylobacter sp.]|uniref:DUF4149 domain-containing protein n=1 Tax=Campylobacter sp. TaxID=205 RepID=UPI002974903F|nr:DUF4149 domain-containing protein [Campylobacter sp.]MDD7600273.1 DUF4149 domain-containing protein [Campylobacteraceae bacterium]MDD7741881.1 DUF4149 domain-containing protein [Campylobacteraceae bacterium]MDY4121300.1 DUF4149 domain-containing protein [Campylobacter sp.]MDY5887805.1 DUF4149 domain-containing protein [Campylobacter sp.]
MKALSSIYLFILALTLGVEVAIGLSAPVLFRSDLYITPGTLSALQAGTLLAQVFMKYNYIALFCGFFALLFEIFSWRGSEASFQLKLSTLMLSLIIAVLACLFYYFTSYITAAAALGESAIDENFARIHEASETTLKIAMIARLGLFFLRAKISVFAPLKAKSK